MCSTISRTREYNWVRKSDVTFFIDTVYDSIKDLGNGNMTELHKHYVLYRPCARPYQGLQNITKLRNLTLRSLSTLWSTLSGLGNVAELENLTLSYLSTLWSTISGLGNKTLCSILLGTHEGNRVYTLALCACYVERKAVLLIFKSRNDVV